MKVLLAFLLMVTAGAMWETRRGRRQGAVPLVALCVLVTATYFGVSRLI